MTNILSKFIHILYISKNVSIYPHIVWNQEQSQNELNDLAIKLKNSLPEYNFIIYSKDSYCNELVGDCNVCFGIIDYGITYMYMLRSCSYSKKCFGCPFINTNYIYKGHIDLSYENYPNIFEDLEDNLYELLIKQNENPILIDSFEI